jgi:hypothetical protein
MNSNTPPAEPTEPHAPTQNNGRRHVRDGGVAVLLLAVAVFAGYVALHADTLRAKTVSPAAGTLPATKVASVGTSEPSSASATPSATPSAEIPQTAPAPAPPRPTWAGTVTGRVLGADRQPAAGASIAHAGTEIRVDAEGAFTLTATNDVPLIVKLPGYEKVSVQPTKGPIEVVLRPHVVKGAYLTYFGVGDRGIRSRVLDLAGRTELNAVVIDVKGDRGWIVYRTEVPLALAAGAQGAGTLKDFDGLMADFKARGLYTIARIVTFKDNVLARHRPDLAIIDTRTGQPWIDRENLAWVDPFREEVWDYNIAIAKEAVRRGFDEVQFDYVRFPTDGKLSVARYAKVNSKETRLPTIAGFLEKARREIGPTGAFVGADVFGYTAFNENDTDIGQRVEELAPHLDFLCPMVYPSGYHVGIPGFRNPVKHPYEVVHESVRMMRKRTGPSVVRVRPWLQDFRDYAFDRRIFGVTEVQAQIKGADDAGAAGWMLWNPRNDYTGAALREKSTLAAR